MIFARLGSLMWLIVFFMTVQVFAGDKFSYSYIPKKIYATQVFPVTILAKGIDHSDQPIFTWDTNADNKPIGTTPGVVANGGDLFYTFYFRVQDHHTFVLPKLSIKQKLLSNTLLSRSIPVQKLNIDKQKDFCGLIASNCTLLSSQVSSFDSNHTLVSIKFKAHEANPEAISIPGATEGGIEKLKRDHALVDVEYYFVIPSHIKDMNISYYNTVEHRFITSHLKTDYHDQPVAAQVELNPKASWFEKLKKYGSTALAFFFGFMFWWRRDILYLALLIVVVYLIYLAYKPNAAICIQEGSPLYILPTHNSLKSTNIKKKLHISTIGEHGKYYKINYHNGIIGWINEEDLCKD